ncbi:prephenate dehydrogenase [Methanomicrobium sp. W14]|uniref:prephenate dehydrogenase/arogenate dehydrogenase family protein n=1 Tax=Methanomicrobium sp. W14 TaxID=2817839 RepID=UPI001AE96824|nr:prephenate dehydrogenase/arogenate dehydrogenase family protein [Methanomicrobium sp. W14]MBP2134107.1 prephenate dehydrogenase [Methanomicrobium sp. W14]
MDSGVVIGIIGGFGGMGRLFSGVFEAAGYSVTCSGRNTPVSNEEIALTCDIVIVSVPIHDTVRVIGEIAPLLNDEQLLCDFTSLKTEPVRAMLKSKAKVIGLHPMFGPSVSGISGQTIVASPARCDERTQEVLYNIFRKQGADVCIMTPEKHDKVMSIVQGLVHFSTLCVAETIKKTGISPDELLPVMSPVYRIETGLIGRILGQDPALYADILQQNPQSEDVMEKFLESAEKLQEIVKSKDIDRFTVFFSENRKVFENVIPQATKDTDLLIDTLAGRR